MTMFGNYDFIASIGFNCSVASQLKGRNLRTCSSPFDWLLKESPTALEETLELLDTRFANFLKWENMRLKDSSNEKNENHCHAVHDFVNHTEFLHDFKAFPLSHEDYTEVREKYLRRIDRFYRNCAEAGRILFCVSGTGGQLSKERLIAARERLESIFPNKIIHLFAVVFEADETGVNEFSEEGLVVSYTQRSRNDIDVLATATEWRWLNAISPSGQKESFPDVKNLSFKDRVNYGLYKYFEAKLSRADCRVHKRMISYKLYKHFRKQLFKAGILNAGLYD